MAAVQQQDQQQEQSQSKDILYGLAEKEKKRGLIQGIIYSDLVKNLTTALRQDLKERADEKATRDSEEGVRFRVFLSSQNSTSGMWLLVYRAYKLYRLAPAEFIKSCCRRNTVVNPFILKANQVNDESLQQTMVCNCVGRNRQQPRIDLYGIHILKCPKNGTPTRVELDDPQVQNGKIQSTMRYWTTDLSAVINKAASRAILAVTRTLVDKVNSTPPMAPSCIYLTISAMKL